MNARQKLMAQILMGNQSPQQRIDGAFDQMPQGPTPQQRIDQGFAAAGRPQQPPIPEQGIPMPMARPAGAPQPPQPPQIAQPMNIVPQGAQTQQPDMSWFTRNSYLQRDPLTGEYLDPNLAAKALG